KTYSDGRKLVRAVEAIKSVFLELCRGVVRFNFYVYGVEKIRHAAVAKPLIRVEVVFFGFSLTVLGIVHVSAAFAVSARDMDSEVRRPAVQIKRFVLPFERLKVEESRPTGF